MNNFEIRDLLRSLSIKRPIFHSEADFQFSLAWEIKEKFPEADIRLELPFGEQKKEYLDILVTLGNQLIPIELKYKTKKSEIEFNNEKFFLKNHSAYNVNRFNFLKDVERIERFVEVNNSPQGYTVILTDDHMYWNQNDKNILDKEFSVQEGRLIEGTLSWKEGEGIESAKYKNTPIQLRNRYVSKWEDYSEVDNNSFRMVIFATSD